MNTEQLETLLSLRRETQTFEVKSAVPWDVIALVKDILAMANHRDGGAIVIGVEDRSFVRQGVDARIIASYDTDKMRAQMRKFADPPVRFEVEVVADVEGKEYVVISVASFDRIPVISRGNNNRDVFPGMVYYRNSESVVESAAISNADDMLELILTAVNRTRLWLKGHGFAPRDDEFDRGLDEELGDL